jgi:hypothetical protein
VLRAQADGGRQADAILPLQHEVPAARPLTHEDQDFAVATLASPCLTILRVDF